MLKGIPEILSPELLKVLCEMGHSDRLVIAARALLAVTHFRYPRLSWLDGRCVQGPGTYSPRHG